MNDAANDAAQGAADAYARLERDLTAVKTDVAHLAQQIADAVNALAEIAEAQARRGIRRARGQVGAMASDATDRAASIAGSAEEAASSFGDALTEAIRDRPIAAVAVALGVGFLLGLGRRR